MTHEINLDHITKIEGHAKLHVKVSGSKVQDVKMEVFEGSRFFEGIVKTRKFDEASPLTSRICGVCSVVHSITALQAVENALGIKPSKATRQLRELMHIGGMLQSHYLHLYFLALPDYLGLPDALVLSSKNPKELRRGIGLKRVGNEIIRLLGGREVHPITQKINGFTSLPSDKAIEFLKEHLQSVLEDAKKCAKLFSSLNYPSFERDSLYLALDKKNQYALLDGKLVSSDQSISQGDYAVHLDEVAPAHSTSKTVSLHGESFMNGAMARLNLKGKKLCNNAREALEFGKEKNIVFPAKNPFFNNFAQSVECVHLLCRAVQLCDEIDLSKEKEVSSATPQYDLPDHVRGVSVTEAPRGLLFHDYTIEKDGSISWANIITPTTQNLKRIEDDVRLYLPALLKKPQREIILELEKLIRAYDPCISCATHFLDVKITRL
ncbi:MAG: Ni/Fe hydrogenase subunit alpha [Candidatus Micrarchaeia archaeon]